MVLILEGSLSFLQAAIPALKRAALDFRPFAAHRNRDRREVPEIRLKRIGKFAAWDAEIENDIASALDQGPQAT